MIEHYRDIVIAIAISLNYLLGTRRYEEYEECGRKKSLLSFYELI